MLQNTTRRSIGKALIETNYWIRSTICNNNQIQMLPRLVFNTSLGQMKSDITSCTKLQLWQLQDCLSAACDSVFHGGMFDQPACHSDATDLKENLSSSLPICRTIAAFCATWRGFGEVDKDRERPVLNLSFLLKCFIRCTNLLGSATQ